MSGQGSPSQWYVARDGQQHGPLSDAEMRLFVQGGHLKPADLIWRPGFPDWKPATEVFPPRKRTAASKASEKPAETAPEKTGQAAGGGAATITKATETAPVAEAKAADPVRTESAASPERSADKPESSQPSGPAAADTGSRRDKSAIPSNSPTTAAPDKPLDRPRQVIQRTKEEASAAWSAGMADLKSASSQDRSRATKQQPAPVDSPRPSAKVASAAPEKVAADPAGPSATGGPAAWPSEVTRPERFVQPSEKDGMSRPAQSPAPQDPFDPDTWQQAEARHAGRSAHVGANTAKKPATTTSGATQELATARGASNAEWPRGPSIDRQHEDAPAIAPQPRPQSPPRPQTNGPASSPTIPAVSTAPRPRPAMPAPVRPGSTEPPLAAQPAVAPSKPDHASPAGSGYPPFSDSDLPTPIGRAPDTRAPAPRIQVPPQDDSHRATARASQDEGRAGLGRIAAVVTGLVVLSGLGYTGYTHRDTIAGVVANAAQRIIPDEAANDPGPPVIRVEPRAADRDASIETAALDTRPSQGIASDAGGAGGDSGSPEAGTTPPADPIVALDREFSKSDLWSLIKRDFPDWYDERLNEVAQMSKDRTETDVSAHLITRLVNLRRSNARHALAASPEKLEDVAEAFLANLQSLTAYSTDACFRFISQGESSPAIVELISKQPYGAAIERQIAAIFRAIDDGKASPNTRKRAEKTDYDQLASELGKLGWDQADLKLFADPTALSKAPPERVCKMVQDWFQAHIAISDKSIQERLLFETLRPVVAG